MSSSQDGAVGRDTKLPCPTKWRITTNLKSINNQKHQKIKLHGTPTTKELKSTRPTRLVGTCHKVADHKVGPTERNLSEAGTMWVGLAQQETETQSWLWTMAGWPQWEKLPVSLEGSLESGLEMSKQAALFPLWPLPHRQHPSAARRVALPW